MGFLALAQQAPWALQAPQEFMGMPVPQPAPMPQPQRPRAFAPNLPQAPTQLPDQRQQSPLAGLPQFNGASAIRPPSFSERVEGMTQSPLFQTGLALLGAGQPGGGGWGQAGQDIMAINAANAQRQRQERADQRETQAWDWQQQQQQRQQGQYAAYEQAVAEADPALRNQLLAMGPEGYAQYQAQTRQMDFQRSMAADERRFQERENARNRFAQGNQVSRYFQSRDAEALATANERTALLRSNALPALQTLRENILRAGQDATGQPIDYNTRIQMNRVFNGQGPSRQALETWQSRIVPLALQNLPPGPATDRDVELVMNAFANPNMSLGSALELIDEQIARYQREIATAQAQNDFYREVGQITGGRNRAGQDFGAYLESRLGGGQGGGQNANAPAAQQQGGARVTRSAALTNPSQEPVGTRAMDGQYVMVVVRGPDGVHRWVRENFAQNFARNFRAAERGSRVNNIGAGTR